MATLPQCDTKLAGTKLWNHTRRQNWNAILASHRNSQALDIPWNSHETEPYSHETVSMILAWNTSHTRMFHILAWPFDWTILTQNWPYSHKNATSETRMGQKVHTRMKPNSILAWNGLPYSHESWVPYSHDLLPWYSHRHSHTRMFSRKSCETRVRTWNLGKQAT